MQQKKNILISLVIPCYNESSRIVHLEQGIREFRQKWEYAHEVIIVDDGSQDDTSRLVKESISNINLIQLPQNEGKGGALRTGVLAAKGDFVLTLDADMATHPLELNHWLSLLPKHEFTKQEILIASRNHPDSKIEARSHRKFAGQLFNGLVRLLTPIQLSDTQCGFKLYPRKIAQLLFQDLEIKGWAHDIELLYKAGYLKIPVRAMPINWKHVDDEKISVMSDGIKMAKQTSIMAFRYRLLKSYRKKLSALKSKYESLKE